MEALLIFVVVAALALYVLYFVYKRIPLVSQAWRPVIIPSDDYGSRGQAFDVLLRRRFSLTSGPSYANRQIKIRTIHVDASDLEAQVKAAMQDARERAHTINNAKKL